MNRFSNLSTFLLASSLIVAALNQPVVLAAASGNAVMGEEEQSASQSSDKPTDKQETPLTKLNGTFRDIYREEKEKIQNSTYPVIVAVDDKVLMYKDAQNVTEVHFVPDEWTTLKIIDHLPLALFVLLRTHDDGSELSRGVVQKLEALQSEAQSAELEISNTEKLPANLIARQRHIIDTSLQFIAQVLAAHRVQKSELSAFIDKMSPADMLNADDAESFELSKLDSAVQNWRTSLTPDEWQRLQVVIVGGHMPRLQERRFQYFGKLLGEKTEGERIVYMEGSGDAHAALALLATHNLDRQISYAFFHTAMRMHRDLLSDAARRYLQKHPPKSRAQN